MNRATDRTALAAIATAMLIGSATAGHVVDAGMKATVILQHDVRDITKLPAFPAGAK